VSARRTAVQMKKSEETLLGRLLREEDPDTFAAIVREYAPMVYGASHRVLGDDPMAADVVQETFYELSKSADRITESLGSWLHKVATRRAIDRVRENQSRRKREAAYAAQAIIEEEPWAEVEPLVDEALEELSPRWRELLVMHYLDGKSMTQIALLKGLSQPTVSRRITEGLHELRKKLRDRGVIISAVVLGTLLSETAQAVPERLLHSLHKLVLTKAAAGAQPPLAGAFSGIASGLKVALAITALAAVSALSWFAFHDGARLKSGDTSRTALAADLPETAPSTRALPETNKPTEVRPDRVPDGDLGQVILPGTTNSNGQPLLLPPPGPRQPLSPAFRAFAGGQASSHFTAWANSGVSGQVPRQPLSPAFRAFGGGPPPGHSTAWANSRVFGQVPPQRLNLAFRASGVGQASSHFTAWANSGVSGQVPPQPLSPALRTLRGGQVSNYPTVWTNSRASGQTRFGAGAVAGGAGFINFREVNTGGAQASGYGLSQTWSFTNAIRSTP
jgi:RNA polymerase sigma factor (sigma-70 family)